MTFVLNPPDSTYNSSGVSIVIRNTKPSVFTVYVTLTGKYVPLFKSGEAASPAALCLCARQVLYLLIMIVYTTAVCSRCPLRFDQRRHVRCIPS